MASATYSAEERMRKQREYRARTGNACTKKYERTKPGKLMRTYRNMQSRVQGILKGKAHLYKGLAILPREEFYRWALGNNTFHELFEGWVKSGYQCGESPSIDRIDAERGYVVGNMRWLTHRENSRRTRRNRPKHSGAELRPMRDAA